MVFLLILRILTALIGIPVIILAIWLGKTSFAIVVSILVVIGALEFSDFVKKKGIVHGRGKVVATAFAFPLLAFFNLFETVIPFALTILILYNLLLRLFSGKVKDSILYTSVGLLIPLYTGFLPSHLILIRDMEGAMGLYFSLITFMIAWSNDTAAYFVGTNFGKRKLCPSVSPKKTFEGAFGGLIGVIVVIFIMDFIMMNQFGITVSFSKWHLFFISIIASLAATFGDLVESMLKRDANLKDSGNIIPGHGGVLDRFDSVFFVAPIVYYYIKFLVGL